jgi:hypothetical protein
VSDKRYKLVDFNSVLMAINIIVVALLIYVMPDAANNEYIDQRTIMLGILLCAQTHVGLQIERKRRDPFVILFAFTMIFYFSFRIFTLAEFPFSVVFARYSYRPENSNYALVFILIANLFLYAGFFWLGFRERRAIDSTQWRAASPGRLIALTVVSIIYSYFSGIYWTADELPRAVSLAGVFVSPAVILLMTLSYFLLFRSSLRRTTSIAIVTLLVLEMIAHTLAGSRSGITTLIQNAMLAILAIGGCIRIRRSHLVWSIVLVPVLLVLLIGAFTVSTYNRSNKGESIDFGRLIALTGEAGSQLGENSDLRILLPPIFNRAGFFDYSAEIIANKDRYESAFNLGTYAKSIIDNLLTPGFDVYDQPKISNALQFIYDDLGTPSKEQLTEDYQSDQFGVYGEFFALFGWASLPLFFLVAFFLKRIYVRLKSESPFALAMKRVLVLSVFVKILDSYGMDWTIIETVPFAAALYLYRFFFRSRKVPRGGTADDCAGTTPFPAPQGAAAAAAI